MKTTEEFIEKTRSLQRTFHISCFIAFFSIGLTIVRYGYFRKFKEIAIFNIKVLILL